MKKIICVFLAVIMLGTIFTVNAGAFFTSGYTTAASEVKVVKSGLVGKKLTFSDSDFKSAFCLTDFDSITIDSLPSSLDGTLLIAGRRAREGQTVKRRQIATMVFVPKDEDVAFATFSFTLKNDGVSTPSTCEMKFINKINYAPRTPEDKESSLTLTTQAAISVFGRLGGEDPEGDKLEYIIVIYPKNGILSFTDKEGGAYKYTPVNGFTGYDDFTYVLRDEYGNYSEPQEVGIRVIERMGTEIYVDMTERSEYNAAVAMSAMGIMSGKTLGDDKYFMPDETVSRAEFVAMAMKAYGMRADSSLKKSFFDDNSDIPTSLVSYVATAQRIGLVNGDFTEAGLVFEPNRSITRNEAAQIIASLLGIVGSEEDSEYIENSSVTVTARPYVSAMFVTGIFDGDIEAYVGEDSVTRADAAEYLYRMLKNK